MSTEQTEQQHPFWQNVESHGMNASHVFQVMRMDDYFARIKHVQADPIPNRNPLYEIGGMCEQFLFIHGWLKFVASIKEMNVMLSLYRRDFPRKYQHDEMMGAMLDRCEIWWRGRNTEIEDKRRSKQYNNESR